MQGIHANKGEVVVESYQGFPFLIQTGDVLFVAPPEISLPRSLRVAHVTRRFSSAAPAIHAASCDAHSAISAPASAIVAFEGITSISDATKLQGRFLFMESSHINPCVLASIPSQLLHKEVVDRTFGSLGTLTEILSSSAQDTWVVRGRYGDVLIPVHDTFVDMDSRMGDVLYVHIPKSLLTLSTGTDAPQRTHGAQKDSHDTL
nr:hypothetical protein [Fannyhessea vaginae]